MPRATKPMPNSPAEAGSTKLLCGIDANKCGQADVNTANSTPTTKNNFIPNSLRFRWVLLGPYTMIVPLPNLLIYLENNLLNWL